MPFSILRRGLWKWWLQLPPAQVEEPKAAYSNVMLSRPMARVLVVEDNRELASLIAESSRARGHEAEVAYLGKEALGAAVLKKFDVAVIDLLLPDVRGSEVLQYFAAQKTPTIAISGVFRGHRYAEEATRIYKAAAFFEKPFELHALLDAVERAIPAPVSTNTHPQLDDLGELSVLHDKDGAPQTGVYPFGSRHTVWSNVPQWIRTGSLRTTSVARLINAFYAARHSGELKLKRGKILKVIYFESGFPVYAASNLAEERFGRFCIRKRVLTAPAAAKVEELAREKNLRTAQAMMELELLRPEQHRALIEDQVKEIIWSSFVWDDGEYHFAPKRPNLASLVPLRIFPGNLILEGVARELPLVKLRTRMLSSRTLFPSLDPPYELHAIQLSDDQAFLLSRCDGIRSVEVLLSESDLSEREALGTLVALEWLGFLEERLDDTQARRISFGL